MLNLKALRNLNMQKEIKVKFFQNIIMNLSYQKQKKYLNYLKVYIFQLIRIGPTF